MGGKRHVLLATVALGCALVALGVGHAAPGSNAGDAQQGGIFRIAINSAAGVDYMDPALGSFPPAWALLDTTCARLMTYRDEAPPAGFRLRPDVAAGFPTVTDGGRTYTFKLRTGFRFSDGSRLRADAFAHAINRILAPEMNSPAVLLARDIVGAGRVLSGKASKASGVQARGNTLVIRLTRPTPDFLHRTASTYFCAVPPSLPVDPEGRGAFPAAGPFYVDEYRPGERIVIRRNRFYGGSRPHHVDGFDVDLRAASPQEVLQRVDRGEADWGHTLAGIYFQPGLGLVEKYGINRTRLFVRPGLTLRVLAFNSARGRLFHNNPDLRRAVNFALNRGALSDVGSAGGPASRGGNPSDQYLPPLVPGFRDADVYPLERPALRTARRLAKGNLRGGKAILYVNNSFVPLTIGQRVSEQLEAIGLDVAVKGIPIHSASAAYFAKLATPGEQWDLAFGLWSPSYIDPFAYVNLLFDARFAGGTNFSRWASGAYDREMRRAARLPEGRSRSRAYADLDARLARGPAPIAPVDFLKEPTLISDRVGCVVLRPVLDLTAVCLET
jgi:peptide/nickel transport system substrate-binding protein